MLELYPARNRSLTQKAIVEYLIILGFSLFTLLGTLQHELWRDELQAWMLARDSASIFEMLKNMTYEGHPALWHICLFGLAQITHNLLILQLFHWIIAIGVIVLIVKFSPFSTLYKFLLSFSYFFFFEYAVISRGYSLGIFFLLLFCALYDRKQLRPVASALILILAANTSAYGLILSITLAFFMFLDYLVCFPGQHPRLLAHAQGALILGVGWLVSAGQIVRVKLPKEPGSLLASAAISSPALSANASDNARRLPDVVGLLKDSANAIANIWDSYFPIPRLFNIHFWNHNILTENYVYPSIFGVSLGDCIALLLSVIIFAVVAYLLSSKPVILWTYLFGNLMLLAFRLLIHDTASARHYGHFYLVFLMCCWLFLKLPAALPNTGVAARGRHSKTWLNYLLLSVFSVQAAVGIYAMSMDYILPFSNGEAAASFITSEGLQEQFILGDDDKFVSVISGYVGVPIYYPEKQAFSTYWTFEPPELSAAELRRAIKSQVETREQDVVVILSKPLTVPMIPGVKVVLLAQFIESIVPDENYYVYLAQPSAASSTSSVSQVGFS